LIDSASKTVQDINLEKENMRDHIKEVLSSDRIYKIRQFGNTDVLLVDEQNEGGEKKSAFQVEGSLSVHGKGLVVGTSGSDLQHCRSMRIAIKNRTRFIIVK
jgi:hypothetical protein